MAPPAKKQRRLILSSDDEYSQDAEPLSLVNTTRLKRQSHGTSSKTNQTTENGNRKSSTPTKRKASLSSTPTSSPEKKRGKKEDPVKSKSLHSFFQKAPDEQRWQKKELQTEADRGEEELEDIDDDSDDEIPRNTTHPLDRRKAPIPSNNDSRIGQASGSKIYGSKARDGHPLHKFAIRMPIDGNVRPGTSVSQEVADQRPWADKYAPQNLEELGVHKKKVTDVKAWLMDAFSHPQRRHLLILKGPAGSGKTITLFLLARAIGFQLVEWRSSTTSEGGTSTSLVSQFDEFLGRGGRFGSLDLSEPSKATSQTDHEDVKLKRVLVIDELPTTFTRSAAALQTFRSSLLTYLSTGLGAGGSFFSSSKSEVGESPPIVLVVSETLLSSATASMDSLTAHRLLGPEISNHPCTHMIEFNPIAPTYVAKALDIVIKKEARSSRRRRIPGPAILRRLSEMSDVRSAVNSLEFLFLRGDETGDWGGTVASKSKRSSKDNISLTSKEQESLELITQRESTLGMFHAVGRVLYNKRDPPEVSSSHSTSPPDHLQHLHRTQVSQVSVDELMDEAGTDISTFISGLHENYVLSCTGSSFVDHLNGCIDYLSDSDLLDTNSRRSVSSYRAGIGSARPNVSTGSTDLIRQSEINFDVAVRGLLFSLPYPVSRATHPNGKKGDSHKMFFPAALRLWKKTEEIEGVISVWRNRLESGNNLPVDFSSRTNDRTGVASWKRNTFDPTRARSDGVGVEDNTPPRCTTSRNDLVTQYLPYLAKIRFKATPTTNNASAGGSGNANGGLTMATQFDGIDPPNDVELDDEAEDENTGASLDNNPDERKTRTATATTMMTMDQQQQMGMEKLYISDDDIEDD